MGCGVGATLKETRRKRGVDLAEVEARTKIRARFLRAIEDEEWEVLPGETYVRSFIRTYGNYLGLNGNALAERQRQSTGAMRPVEAVPRSEPAVLRSPPEVARPGRAGRAAALLSALAVVVALAVVALSSGGGEGGEGVDSAPPEAQPQAGNGQAQDSTRASVKPSEQRPARLSLELATTAEVWVCLLDADGDELVDGQILGPGAVEGPYRSGSFTVSLGNGEVMMTVDGQQASIPETPDPIGFSIGRGGSMRELSEGERPTCT